MKGFLLLALGFFLTLPWKSTEGQEHRLVAYWGQNGVVHKHFPPKVKEESLMYFCQKSKYDTVIMAFCYSFFDARNRESFPSLDFSFHCNTTAGRDYPFMLKCPKFTDAINECHRNGKKVLLSLGGAAGIYGFTNATEPQIFAYRVWNLFLGGTSMTTIRPFGTAVLDGVDLDIEGGTLTGYAEFAKALKDYMKTDPTRSYSITAAPQCPYPDTYLGPGGTKALQTAAKDFDEIHVQFYNNYCTTGAPKFFWPSIKSWLNYSKSLSGPKILIGLPASKGASNNDIDYRPPDELKTIYDTLKNQTRFGGFMLWDASFDQNNIIDDKIYSEYVADILDGRCPGVAAPVPITQSPLSTMKSTRTSTPQSTSRRPPTSTTPPSSTKLPATTSLTFDMMCSKPGIQYFADTTNCRRFYHCSNGKAYLRWCSHNLYWNQSKLTCDWPQNVKCSVFKKEINEIEEDIWV